MSLRAFPTLPAGLLNSLPSDVVYLEQVGQSPEIWLTIPEQLLARFLQHALRLYGITQDKLRIPALQSLYELCTERLAPQQRLQVVQDLAQYIESSRRQGGGPAGLAFLPCIKFDSDSQVVATAALNAAVLCGSGPDDPEQGRRMVFSMAMDEGDPARRASVFVGLLGLTDDLVLTWMRGSRSLVNSEGRQRMLDAAGALPMKSVAEYLLTWAEDALTEGDESDMSSALGALCRMAAVAHGEASSPYAGRGVLDVERQFPAWAYPEDQVIRFRESWTVAEFGRMLLPRLHQMGNHESEPKVVPDVIRRWR